MQINLVRLIQHTGWLLQAYHGHEPKTITEWHKLNALHYRAEFVIDVIMTDNIADEYFDLIATLRKRLVPVNLMLLETRAKFANKTESVPNPAFDAIVKVVRYSLNAPSDYQWTEKDLMRTAQLAYAQAMLHATEDTDGFLSIQDEIFALIGVMLFPYENDNASAVFKDSVYKRRARGLLLSYLLFGESLRHGQ